MDENAEHDGHLPCIDGLAPSTSAFAQAHRRLAPKKDDFLAKLAANYK